MIAAGTVAIDVGVMFYLGVWVSLIVTGTIVAIIGVIIGSSDTPPDAEPVDDRTVTRFARRAIPGSTIPSNQIDEVS